jgi:GNAT superfamily N-acetyltransferase
MQEVKLKEASLSDIPSIAALAKNIWNQHYPEVIGQEQVNYMLGIMYTAEALKQQMEQKKHRFFLIENDGKEVGFISVNEVSKGDWFLNKFYIDQRISAKGIGTSTFHKILELISPKKITLTVNRGNYKTVNFYFKLGFKIEKTAVFDIGNGYVMDDFVMSWQRG